MMQKLVGLGVLLLVGCMSMDDDPARNAPDARMANPPDAPPPPPDADETPDATAPLIVTCADTAIVAQQRWYGCSALDLWTGCEMDTLYNQQTDDGTRCFDCHTAGGTDGNGAGGVLLSDNTEQTFEAYRDPPGMYKLAVPVSGPTGYEGLEMNDIMIRKGNIDNDGHPNYDFNDARLAALDCYMGGMMALFADCNNLCQNP